MAVNKENDRGEERQMAVNKENDRGKERQTAVNKENNRPMAGRTLRLRWQIMRK